MLDYASCFLPDYQSVRPDYRTNGNYGASYPPAPAPQVQSSIFNLQRLLFKMLASAALGLDGQ